MLEHRRIVVGRAGSPTGRSPLRLRPGRPRRHAPAASPPEHRCPKCHTRAVLPGAARRRLRASPAMAASRSPRRPLSRATQTSATGTRKGARLRSQTSRSLHHQLQPAAGGRPHRPDSAGATAQRVFGQAQCDDRWLDPRRSAPPPRSTRTAASHRPEAPRSRSRGRRSRRRRRRRSPGRCFGPSRRRRRGPVAIRDGPATTARCRAMPARLPAVTQRRSRRPCGVSVGQVDDDLRPSQRSRRTHRLSNQLANATNASPIVRVGSPIDFEQRHLFGCQPRRLARAPGVEELGEPGRSCRWPARPCPRRRCTTPAAPRSGPGFPGPPCLPVGDTQHGARGDAHRQSGRGLRRAARRRSGDARSQLSRAAPRSRLVDHAPARMCQPYAACRSPAVSRCSAISAAFSSTDPGSRSWMAAARRRCHSARSDFSCDS